MGSAGLPGNTAEHATLWASGLRLDLGTLGGDNSDVQWPIKNDRGEIAGISETSTVDPLGESWSCSAFFPTVTGHTCLGFVWRQGVMTPLPTLGGNNGFAAGANNRGQVAGWAENTVHDSTCVAPQVLQFEAVVYGPSQGQIHELSPFPGDADGAATAINERGDIVGFSDLPGDVSGGILTTNFHAFLWTTENGMEDLGTLPGDTISEALDINGQGQVVGVSFPSSRAFLWEHGVMTDLNTLIPRGSPVQLISANGINDSGEITGQACLLSAGACTSATPAFLAIPTQAGDGAR